MIQRFFGNIIQQFLKADVEEHLGRWKYERDINVDKNYRNRCSMKNIKTSFGDVELDVPRDRKAEFEPQIVKKYETVCNELDKNLIFYGLITDEIIILSYRKYYEKMGFTKTKLGFNHSTAKYNV